MIGRAAWTLAFAAVAVLAVGTGLDRQSRIDDSLADNVPRPFRSFAQTHTAASALKSDDTAKAVAESVLLAKRRPLPAESLLMLAIALQRAGRDDLASRAMQAAGRRGWRIADLQAAALAGAIAAGNAEAAANRLAALWAVGDIRAPELTREVLAMPSGPVEFGRIAAGSARWQDNFLKQASRVGLTSATAAAIAAANRRDALFDCDALSQTARAFVRNGLTREGAAVWSGPCVRESESDAIGFRPDEGLPAGPFAWHYPERDALGIVFRDAASGTAVDYRNSEGREMVLARRLAMAEPGLRALTIATQGGSGLLRTSVDCIDGASGRRIVLAQGIGDGRLSWAVAPGRCAVLEIVMRAGRGAREGVEISGD